MRSMISIPGSLNFAKLVMMSVTPAKSAGVADNRTEIYSFTAINVVPCNLDSNLYYECVQSYYRRRTNKLQWIPMDQGKRLDKKNASSKRVGQVGEGITVGSPIDNCPLFWNKN